MTEDELLAEFERCGAWQKGHFILSSGRHADTYFNKAKISMRPNVTERVCRELARRLAERHGKEASVVVSPAMGAVLFGYETARHLDVPFVFTEREAGRFAFRRGFSLEKDQPVIMVEDVISTGLSARECAQTIAHEGGRLIGIGCLLDRSGGRAEFGVPVTALIGRDIPSYAADDLPNHLAQIEAMKPGSRGLA